MESAISWPPPFSLKKHPRARHVKLKTSVKCGLELVVPLKFNMTEIPIILNKNRKWIEKQLFKIQQQKNASYILPSAIQLNCLNETWSIEYIKVKQTKLKLFVRKTFDLVLIGEHFDPIKCKPILINWLKYIAKIILPEELNKISKTTGLTFQSVSIRDQLTRWGSCSNKKTISLNYKLLFLPLPLLRHVLIHELCHTKYMNHSPQFWRLVGVHDSNWEIHKKELKSANNFVPDWLK